MWTTPTLAQLIERVKQDLASSLSGSDPWLRSTFESVLSRVLGYLGYAQHQHIEFEAGQTVPHRAEGLRFWDWFRFFGLARKDVVRWEGVAQATASVPGPVLMDQTILVRADGAQFAVSGTVNFPNTNPTNVVVYALAPGAASNSDPGVTLSLQSPISGLNSDMTVTVTSQTGVDLESEEDARARMVSAAQNGFGGGGGAPGDYQRWALEVAGVTRAWEYPKADGPGTVAIAFVRDNESPIVPDALERQEVVDYVQLQSPPIETITARVLTEAPLAVTLSVLPNTVEVQAAVTDELEDMLIRQAEPGGTIFLSNISEAISLAAGEESHTLSVPSADVVASDTEIIILGTVTFL